MFLYLPLWHRNFSIITLHLYDLFYFCPATLVTLAETFRVDPTHVTPLSPIIDFFSWHVCLAKHDLVVTESSSVAVCSLSPIDLHLYYIRTF